MRPGVFCVDFVTAYLFFTLYSNDPVDLEPEEFLLIFNEIFFGLFFRKFERLIWFSIYSSLLFQEKSLNKPPKILYKIKI